MRKEVGMISGPVAVPATDEESAGPRASYNVIDEPWIPIIRADGAFTRLGLRESLVHAHELREVIAEAPTETVALYRLLLALVHCVYGPASQDAWMTLWDAGQFDPAPLDAYFTRWRDRFDLFDAEHPFAQTPGILSSLEHSVSRLAHERSSRTDKILFDHRFDAERSPMAADKAARALLASHAFGTGGLISSDGPSGKGSAAAGPLTNVAVTLVRGSTLFHTLMLNAVTYCPEEEIPFSSAGDAPVWEIDQVVTNRARSPSGYLDWLTYPSRRILLGKPIHVGTYQVATATLMEGYRLPHGIQERDVEQMVGFVQVEGKNGPAWVAVRPRSSGLAWRDRLALMHAASPAHHHGVLNHLHGLKLLGAEGLPAVIEVDVLGFVPDQASPVAWMHERFSFPAAYLSDQRLFASLSRAVDFAHRMFWANLQPRNLKEKQDKTTPTRTLGLLLAGGLKPDANRADAIVGADGIERHYWNGLATSFDQLIFDLPDQGDDALLAWSAAVCDIARAVFTGVSNRASSSGRGLRAAAIAGSAFNRRLAWLRAEFRTSVTEGAQ